MWNLVLARTSKFFKDSKIAQAVYKSLLHQIAREIMLFMLKMYMKKYITKSQNRKNLERVLTLHAICVLCKNALIFSQSKACNFCMYIITKLK